MLLLAALAFAGPAEDAVRQRMSVHFGIAAQIRSAVVDGDLEEASARAKQLAALGVTGLPEGWAPRIEGLQRTARNLHDVDNPVLAGQIVGQMGVQCASCHLEQKKGPKVPDLSGVDRTALRAPGAHMHLHRTASEWLWIGLIANDAATWKAGAALLAEAPANYPVSDELVDLEKQVHAWGSQAAAANNPATRAEQYGALLELCARCHVRAR